MDDRHQEFVTATGNKQRFRAASLDAFSAFNKVVFQAVGRTRAAIQHSFSRVPPWLSERRIARIQENPNNSLRRLGPLVFLKIGRPVPKSAHIRFTASPPSLPPALDLTVFLCPVQAGCVFCEPDDGCRLNLPSELIMNRGAKGFPRDSPLCSGGRISVE